MKHLGDITKISGSDAPVVDVIIGGSPCQDLSIAGKRAGLAGERSGLYMEQIRIIKEMREADALRGRTDELIRPRYMVWENVPGAFSSNGGKDFAAVLEEAIRVAEPEAPAVPVPEKGWPTSGCFFDVDGRWSVAWRVMDAQYWGVPQRRRRICLVADFNGLNAPKILFGEAEHNGSTECAGGKPSIGYPGAKSRSEVQPLAQGVRGHFEESRTPWQTVAVHAQDCAGADDREGESGRGTGGRGLAAVSGGFCPEQSAKTRGIGWEEEMAPTLRAGVVPGVVSAVTLEPGIAAREGGHVYEGVSGTLRANAGDNRMAVAYSFDSLAPNSMKSSNPHSGCRAVEVAKTLDTTDPNPCKNQGGIAIVERIVLDDQGGQQINVRTDGKCPTLRAEMHGNIPAVMEPTVYSVENHPADSRVDIDWSGKVQPGMKQQTFIIDSIGGQAERGWEGEVAPTLKATHYKSAPCVTVPVCMAAQLLVRYIVRRLTPLECERLQGFPDGWTDIGEWVDSKGKKHKEADSPRYKALGNSIALPPWKWVLKRLCACYERDATMASLFDGIGGFPYIWEQLNGKGSCLWASEIEEFPMAVTRLRFGGEK